MQNEKNGAQSPVLQPTPVPLGVESGISELFIHGKERILVRRTQLRVFAAMLDTLNGMDGDWNFIHSFARALEESKLSDRKEKKLLQKLRVGAADIMRKALS